MIFNSLIFVVFFLPIFLSIFFLCPKKYRYIILLFGSLVFYLYCGVTNFIILLSLSIFNYLAVILIDKMKKRDTLFIILGLINLFSLFTFKYDYHLILPLGMSFYTFHNVMYILDVRNHKIEIEKNYFYYLTYVVCFVHVTMGPLISYNKVKESFSNLTPTWEDFYKGYQRFIWGFVKKVLVADNLGYLHLSIQNIQEVSVLSNVCMILVYGFQLFIDFASYTDMAIGLGKMIGINYPENFDHPYYALSVSDFWRRWHMTLMKFLRDYVYIPLGGNRVSKVRHVINLLIVWCLTGMWHGNTWNYLLWGIYYFFVLWIEKMFLQEHLEKLPNSLRHLYVLFFVFVGTILFSIPNLEDILFFIKSTFTSGLIHSNILFFLKENIVLLIASILLCTYLPDWVKGKVQKYSSWEFSYNLLLIALFILSLSYLVSGSYMPFLYNSF